MDKSINDTLFHSIRIVDGVKGDMESIFRDGDVNIDTLNVDAVLNTHIIISDEAPTIQIVGDYWLEEYGGNEEMADMQKEVQELRDRATLNPSYAYKGLLSKLRVDSNGNTYRVQDVVYASKINKYIVVGGSAKKDGKAMLSVVSDITKWDDVQNYIYDIGHCNSATYNQDRNCIHITTGRDSSGNAEGQNPKNMIVTIDVTNMELVDKLTLGMMASCDAIIYENKHFHVFEYTSDWRIVHYVFDSHMAFLSKTNFPTMDEYLKEIGYPMGTPFLRQSAFMYEGNIFFIFTYAQGSTPVGAYIFQCDSETGILIRAYGFNCEVEEEVEGVCLKGDRLYIVTDSPYYFGVREAFMKNQRTNNYRYGEYKMIGENTDLNDVLTSGDYYCWDTGTANTLAHYPSSRKNGFTLEVRQLGGSHILQKMVTNGNRVYYRRFAPDSNRWGEWEREMRYTVDYPTSGVVQCAACVTNSGMDLRITLPIKICYAETLGFTKFVVNARKNGYLMSGVDLLGDAYKLTVSVHNEFAVTVSASKKDGTTWGIANNTGFITECDVSYNIH